MRVLSRCASNAPRFCFGRLRAYMSLCQHSAASGNASGSDALVALIRLGAWVNVLMSVFPPPRGQSNNVTLSSRGGAPVALTLWRCKRLSCRQLHSANTVFDLWLLRRHRAHERLRAFRVPRLIRRVAAIIRCYADIVHRRAMLLAAAVSGRGCILECRAPCAYWSAL